MGKKSITKFFLIMDILKAAIASTILYRCLLVFLKRDKRLYLRKPNKGKNVEIICDNMFDIGAISDGFRCIISTKKYFSYAVGMQKLKVSFEKTGHDNISYLCLFVKTEIIYCHSVWYVIFSHVFRHQLLLLIS